MSYMQIFKFTCLFVVASLLSACSDRPSTTDVQAAIESAILEEISLQAFFSGGDAQAMYRDVELEVERVANCEALQKGSSYICDVEYRISSRSGERPTQRSIESIELVKSDEGWVIHDQYSIR